ncbi:DEAD-box ATP-dependent RNA helicase 53-like [Phalaenopsis equestris]|uniref:DEAD-box ATP-dependent RNA helicase 53-like n=1 Tax=Phalaenopsis equestris TaxID=78828 RepID=UPI0009E2BDB1|nr:DEAD-box ATP-dependent RNA helicase 53-like [Phalaenopsis equestris]
MEVIRKFFSDLKLDGAWSVPKETIYITYPVVVWFLSIPKFYPVHTRRERKGATLFFFSLSSAPISFAPQNPNLTVLRARSSPLAIPASADHNAILHQRCAVPFLSAKVLRTAAPTIPVEEELLDISKIGISEQIVTALSRRGITELFPIQRAVLEPALEGRDMIGRAITGSGKTLAFGIPILDKIIRDQNQSWKKRVPSALVLAPTRELARQVQREFEISAPKLRSICIYGGIPIMSQVRSLGYGMDIVVGTPGRIIDLFERGALDLSEVKFVVLDEADQMLAVGFQEDVERILSYLPREKQCMLFSATMPQWIHDLSRKYLRDPIVVDLVGDSAQKLAEGISLYSISSTSFNKQNLLPTLISMYAQGGKSIIFTKTKRDAESLSRSMGVIIGSKALHGDMQQSQRDKTLAAFRDGRFHALVATDVAARGLDIPNVDLVIHYEIPNTSEIFLHRSGRTGRAGNKGTTVLMFTEGQRRTVRSIEHDLGCKFDEVCTLIF